MADTLSVAGFGLASFAFVCEIISVALPFWMFDEQDGVKVYIGLWIACLDAGSYKTCSSDGATDELRAVQAMVLLGLLSNVVALACGYQAAFLKKENKNFGYAATGFLAATGLFLLIGFSVYTAEIYNPVKSKYDYDLHAGFAFCIIAWIVSWIAAALFGLVLMKPK